MESRHLKKYGQKECSAFHEIANYKWEKEFACTRPDCRYIKYCEGKKPFSRRCLKCTHDESPTAHTVFDKLRMSKGACLELVRMVIESDERLKIEDLTKDLIEMGFNGVNARSVWALLAKVYDVMDHQPVVFDGPALFSVIVKKEQLIVVSSGQSNGRELKNIHFMAKETEIHNLVRTFSMDVANTTVIFVRGLYTPNPKATKVGNRPLTININDAIVLARDFAPWIKHHGAYLYKRNGGNYQELMNILTKHYNEKVK